MHLKIKHPKNDKISIIKAGNIFVLFFFNFSVWGCLLFLVIFLKTIFPSESRPKAERSLGNWAGKEKTRWKKSTTTWRDRTTEPQFLPPHPPISLANLKENFRIFYSLKPYWDKWQIKCEPPPKKMAIFWGGSTFCIFWWCNGRILLKIFLVRILGKRIFLTEFLADRPKFRPADPQMKF